MDVTSLLNASTGTNPIFHNNPFEHTYTPSADEVSTAPSTALPTPSPETTLSRRSSDSRPAKNRTPWDAGGYSLPLSLDTKFQTTCIKPALYGESPLDANTTSTTTPCSSYGVSSSSSPQSRSNSIDSSPLDTVASAVVSPMTNLQPSRPAFLGEEPHLEISTDRRVSVVSDGESQLTARKPSFPTFAEHQRTSGSPKSPRHKFSDSHSSFSSYASSLQSSCHSRISSVTTVSGMQPLGPLLSEISGADPKFGPRKGSIGGPVFGEVRPPSPQLPFHSYDTSPPTGAIARLEINRPRSPSDALMITRGLPSDQPSPTSGISPTNTASVNRNFLLPAQPPARSHKRAISAPDFAGLNISSAYQPFSSISTQSPFASSTYNMASLPNSGDVSNGTIECMFTKDCNTGSQPRKAISHIFGRNKLCTRMIPPSVWVHFCRKHYQRCRYRNAHEWAKRQARLVKEQIDRVQQWSDENQAIGRPGTVKDWSLSVRKREQKRLEDKTGKRESADSDDEGLDGAALNGTAVPDWLLAKCGNGYSTPEIQAIVCQLENEIDTRRLTQIPDIEILPNINNDGAENPRKMGQKRKSISLVVPTTHRRTQSMGLGVHPEGIPMVRRVSQPNNYWPRDEALDTSPVEKRQRLADLPESQNPLPPIRRMHQLPHRPAFSNIQENQPEVSYFPAPQAPIYPPGHPTSQYRRPPHSRSQSDMSSFDTIHGRVPPASWSEEQPTEFRRASYSRPSSSGGNAHSLSRGGPPFESYSSGIPPPRQEAQYPTSQGYLEDSNRPFPYSNPLHSAPRSPRLPSLSSSHSFSSAPSRGMHTRHQSSPNAGRLMSHAASDTYHGFPPALSPTPRRTLSIAPLEEDRNPFYGSGYVNTQDPSRPPQPPSL